jgi:hypothetical protein
MGGRIVADCCGRVKAMLQIDYFMPKGTLRQPAISVLILPDILIIV